MHTLKKGIIRPGFASQIHAAADSFTQRESQFVYRSRIHDWPVSKIKFDEMRPKQAAFYKPL